MIQYELVKRLFQVYNSEQYYQNMMSIEIQNNKRRTQRMTKLYHQVELQGSGEENILM